MSTTSLPSYHADTRDNEHLLASRLRVRRPYSTFVKNSRSGGVVLRLQGQQDTTVAGLPEYGPGAIIEGTVELRSADSVQSADIKVRIYS